MNTPVLTLTEYRAQVNPVHMPIVKLKKGEYEVIERFLYKGKEPIALIVINDYPNYTYAQRGNVTQLLTYTSRYKEYSCFWLTDSETDPRNYAGNFYTSKDEIKPKYEWLVSEDHRTLFTTLPDLAKLTGVEMKLYHKWDNKKDDPIYEYHVVEYGKKINVAKIYAEAP